VTIDCRCGTSMLDACSVRGFDREQILHDAKCKFKMINPGTVEFRGMLTVRLANVQNRIGCALNVRDGLDTYIR
jgi:hypothetical protein